MYYDSFVILNNVNDFKFLLSFWHVPQILMDAIRVILRLYVLMDHSFSFSVFTTYFTELDKKFGNYIKQAAVIITCELAGQNHLQIQILHPRDSYSRGVQLKSL